MKPAVLVFIVALGCGENRSTAPGPPAAEPAAPGQVAGAPLGLGYAVPALCFAWDTAINLQTRIEKTDHKRDGVTEQKSVIVALNCARLVSAPDFRCASAEATLQPANTERPAVMQFSLGTSDDLAVPLTVRTADSVRSLFRETADKVTRSTDTKSKWTTDQVALFRNSFERDFDALSVDARIVADNVSFYLIDPPNKRLIYYSPPIFDSWTRGDSACYGRFEEWLASTKGR